MSAHGRLVGLVLAACTLRDENALRAAFGGLTDDVCDTLTDAVLSHLTDDIKTWAWAVQHCPTTTSRTMGREFAKLIKAGIPPYRPPPPGEQARKEMTRLAFRLLRGGTTARALVAHARAANAQLSTPLPDSKLDDLLVWCVKTHMENTNAR